MIPKMSIMETESEFDMKHYLSLTGGSSDDTNTVNLNLLKSLVYNHVSNINYQNYDLLTGKEILDMTPNGLLQRLLVDRRGGMCYETYYSKQFEGLKYIREHETLLYADQLKTDNGWNEKKPLISSGNVTSAPLIEDFIVLLRLNFCFE
ncbi:unnamed protein product [Nesidiocoris tenuis]|uniref:arylamine N-acetyltransferase n=1 Tax=Nesidiocoris tenuis TaxID=355587 RepID=A0A6H5HRI2_9HEMI|nr:unnamed protein product [Nesidiocoris tenuis]